jgi:DNA repair protein RecO (recombination protein O)
MSRQRVTDESAYVLHRYDWSESSLILEVFTRHHGRMALVARGAKKPSSGFRPVLLPLQGLRLSFGGEGEIRSLKSAQWQGGHVMPTGEALLSGYYLNELIMRLLARDDPHPRLFDAYAAAVQLLATPAADVLQPTLRAFELRLLRDVGWLPALDRETASLTHLDRQADYVLVPEAGLRLAHADDTTRLSGSQWLALSSALGEQAGFEQTLQAVMPLAAPLKRQLRTLLHYHCGISMLKTRQLMHDLQTLAYPDRS